MRAPSLPASKTSVDCNDRSPVSLPRPLTRLAAGLGLLAALACSPTPEGPAKTAPTHLDPAGLIEWNEAVLQAAEEEDGFLTLKGLRTATMLHIAIWGVLASQHPSHGSVLAAPSAEAPQAGTAAAPSLDAKELRIAVHRAAHDVAAAAFPERGDQFADLYARHAEQALASTATSEADALGQRIARAVLDARTEDGWDGEAEYTWHPMAPGVYAEFEEHSGTPKGFIFGAGWAQARPFVLPSPDHFRAPPPPAIDSSDYATAFDEVKELGAAQSATRTADQAHLAMWWKDFAENSHNRLARQLVVERALDGTATALLFARLNMAIYDAYVGVFDNKFHYNHWRPYTAIRWAENDGNGATVADPEWTNLHNHTYAFPSYPSAHGTACASAMTVLADTFGGDTPFVMTTTSVDQAGPFSGKVAMDPPTRAFGSFDEAAVECGLSRLYLGIHFRYDSDEGTALGRRIGNYVLEHTPRLSMSP